MFLGWSIWTLLAAASSSRANSDVPIQADLLFPLNNTVYNAAIYPMPIVYRISNASADWNSTGSFLTWQLETPGYDYPSEYPVAQGGFAHYDATDPTVSDVHTDLMWDDLAIRPTYGHTVWRLWLSFGIVDECHPNNTATNRPSMYHVDFNISSDGIFLDLSNPAFCGLALGGLMPMNPHNNSLCPTNQSSTIIPQPLVDCSVKGSTNLTDSVLLSLGQIFVIAPEKNITWPNGGIPKTVSTILAKFNPSKSQAEDTRQTPGLVTVIALSLFAIWIGSSI